MAYLDSATGHLKLQIVYDGAPFSGKTSSVVALGCLLGSPVDSPGEEQGRTNFFDWMDYSGGLCHGNPVQCRVLTVPGQVDRTTRRELLLSAADAVLFVVDTSAGSFAVSQKWFESLGVLLGHRRYAPPVVLQLNKRDEADALPTRDVIDMIDPTLPYVETVATKGDGIREAFVLSVSLSIRGLRTSGRLYPSGVFDTQELQLPDREQLLELLQQV